MTKQPEKNNLRFDLEIIASWIEEKSNILDLGCGEGDLLYYLKKNKQIRGTGIENSEAMVDECVKKGLTVLHGDIHDEILDYPENSFDYIVLSHTLQQVLNPGPLIESILKIGRKGIVSFPNFGHLSARFQLLLYGHAPITRQLPYEWYDTPNIRVLTLKDFRKLAKDFGFQIFKEVAIDMRNEGRQARIINWWPNFRASYGIY